MVSVYNPGLGRTNAMISLNQTKFIKHNEKRKWKNTLCLLAHAGIEMSEKYKERHRLSMHAMVLFYKGTMIRVPQRPSDSPEEIINDAMDRFVIDWVADTEVLTDVSVVSFCYNPIANSTYSFVRFNGNSSIYNLTMSKNPESDTADLSVLFATQQRKRDYYTRAPVLVRTFDGTIFVVPDMYREMIS